MKHTLIGALLGCVLMLVIGAASVDTTGRFGNMNLSGYLSLSGETNRLTVANDELLLDGSAVVPSSASIWDNTDGVISPASGQETNILRFIGGLADGSTAIALQLDTASELSDASARLASFKNAGTEKFGFFANGRLASKGLAVTDASSPVNIDPGLAEVWGEDSKVIVINGGTPGGYETNTFIGLSADGGSSWVARIGSAAITLSQGSEPAAPAAGKFTLFAVDNGGGKMVLKVRFPTGASQTIATEP